MELIVDAGARDAAVGLSARGQLQWRSGALDAREHTRQMLPALLDGLQTLSLDMKDIEAVVVAIGPGPFSGLRVAVSLAKGLAVGLNARTVGVSTLEAEAWRCLPSQSPVRPVVSAGRTGFVTSSFQWTGNEWSVMEEARFLDADCGGCFSLPERFCGDVAELCDAGGWEKQSAEPHTATAVMSRLEAIAALGWRRLAAGISTPVAELQPFYLRTPHITIARDRRP